jgi:hypothetical protein
MEWRAIISDLCIEDSLHMNSRNEGRDLSFVVGGMCGFEIMSIHNQFLWNNVDQSVFQTIGTPFDGRDIRG